MYCKSAEFQKLASAQGRQPGGMRSHLAMACGKFDAAYSRWSFKNVRAVQPLCYVTAETGWDRIKFEIRISKSETNEPK